MPVEWDGERVLARVRAAALRGVMSATHMVHAEATSLILETPKSGRIYRRRGVEHQASAPGEPFASDTGATVQSGRVEIDAAQLTGTVHWSTAYAGYLEFGTARMEPRPYARPALANKTDEIVEEIRAEVEDSLS